MASGRTLWIVDPSLSCPEDEGVAEILDGWPGAHRLFRPGLVPADGPGPGSGYSADAVVVMGSKASVTEDLPWVARLATWLRPLLDGSLPVPLLGICFGHQLIAHLAGAAVGPLDPGGVKRVGVETSRLDRSSLLPENPLLRVVVSHRDEVKQCPAGFRVVARRPGVPFDGLEHAELPVFSFQFHPEAREEFADHAGIDRTLIDARLRRDSRRLLRAFLERATG